MYVPTLGIPAMRHSYISLQVGLLILSRAILVNGVAGVSTFNDVQLWGPYIRNRITYPPLCSIAPRRESLAQVSNKLIQALLFVVFISSELGFLPTNSQGNGIFASAMSDLSPLWIGAVCQGTMDANKW